MFFRRPPRHAPWTETQRALVAIWAELLQLQPQEISVRANFFDLGGHSLLLIRLSSRISDRFGVQLTAKKLFELPDIVEIGHFIDGIGELHQIQQHFAAMPAEGVTEMEIVS